ncbi:MAG: YggT family protein [Chloroflexi bacterium]|nr:MAG: YggT family protein [Chloroflexota bacterium]TMC73468.1 MAG: YggT family protein [Chloroflexota bacterium]
MERDSDESRCKGVCDMERHETEVVRDESSGMVREESHVTTSGAGAPVAADDTQVVSKAAPARRAIEVIYLVFGIIDALLLIRMLLKLMGASTAAPFANFIYDVSGFLLAPFKGLLPAMASGKSVFEPSVLIAILVYSLLAFALAKIIAITLSRSVMVSRRSSSRDYRPRVD